MPTEEPQIRACAVGLTALYLRAGSVRTGIERRRWQAVHSAFRRREATIESLGECARREGLHAEALVLDSTEILNWAEQLVDKGKVLTAADEGYPSRWLRVLSNSAPPAIWRLAGAVLPFETRISVVGGRQIGRGVRQFADGVGRAVAESGAALISGNAIGCDSAAMSGADRAGGAVVGILPHGLERLQRRVEGAEYWSVCAPDEEFSRASAMERNALIYGASEFSVVVHSRLREGGTWHGAADAHRRKLTRLVVADDPRSAGNRALIALGAIPLRSPDALYETIESAVETNLFG